MFSTIRVCLLAAGLMFMRVNVSPAADFPQTVRPEKIEPAVKYSPSPLAGRLVGIAYSTWHSTAQWSNAWGVPTLGDYVSNDRLVIDQHAKWLADAGVDFVWIDWSNNIKYTFDPSRKNKTFDMIEGATHTIFEEYAAMRASGGRTPNISIFAGVTGAPEAAFDGRLQRKVDQIYREYVDNVTYRSLVQNYLGKPLLVIYVNTPSPYQEGTPRWDDPRFTVRWMTGYVTQQPKLRTADGVSRFGYWSWEDRGAQTFTVHDGVPESMVVVASYRKDGTKIPAGERNDGKTFEQQWERARQVGPRIVTVVSWNEWSRGEQPSAQVSKDIEPSKEFGQKYLELLKTEVELFKAGQ